MIMGNAVTFAVGFLLGRLPWQVTAVFAGLVVVMAGMSLRFVDWSAYGPGVVNLPIFTLVAFLPGLATGAILGLVLKRRAGAEP